MLHTANKKIQVVCSTACGVQQCAGFAVAVGDTRDQSRRWLVGKKSISDTGSVFTTVLLVAADEDELWLCLVLLEFGPS